MPSSSSEFAANDRSPPKVPCPCHFRITVSKLWYKCTMCGGELRSDKVTMEISHKTIKLLIHAITIETAPYQDISSFFQVYLGSWLS